MMIFEPATHRRKRKKTNRRDRMKSYLNEVVVKESWYFQMHDSGIPKFRRLAATMAMAAAKEATHTPRARQR